MVVQGKRSESDAWGLTGVVGGYLPRRGERMIAPRVSWIRVRIWQRARGRFAALPAAAAIVPTE
jgi:hypothetical protein